MKSSTIIFSEMNTKIEIKEEDPLSDDVQPQNEKEFFTKVVSMKAISDMLLDNICDVAIKTEVKPETLFLDICSQIKSETLTPRNNSKKDMKTATEGHALISDFGSQNEREFLLGHPLMQVKKCNSDHEADNEIEIKDEPLLLEAETSFVCDDIKDGDLPPVKSSRLCIKAASGESSENSTLAAAEHSGRYMRLCTVQVHSEYESKANDIKIPTEECVYSEQFDGIEKYSRTLHLKEKNLIHKNERPHKCTICEKSFTRLSHLRNHNLIHEGKKPHQCKTCAKDFTHLSALKRHNIIHEGKKPYQCKTCDKSFSDLSVLKRHNLIHEGKRPYQCKSCHKSFALLSYLKIHNLIHEGKRPHQCKTCDKTFTQLSHLKSHNLLHEGKKPHQCIICAKSFTQISNLRAHSLVHEVQKPHQCKTCDKSFITQSSLRRHNLVHENNKSHECKTCSKTFTHLSNLKRHIFIHEVKRPYQCKICEKSFGVMSGLKRHNLIHERKNAQ